jgi:hypothetical protein
MTASRQVTPSTDYTAAFWKLDNAYEENKETHTVTRVYRHQTLPSIRRQDDSRMIGGMQNQLS